MKIRLYKVPWKATLPIVFVLVLGFALRIWGINFGLPHIYHRDENFEVYRALALGVGDYNWERISKSGYFYLLFFEYCLYFLLMYVVGVFHSPQEFGLSILKDPTIVWLIGRSTTALIGTINLFVVYLIGRRIHSHLVGIISSFLLATTYLHVRESHYVTVDIPLTCLVAVCLYFAVRIYQADDYRNYIKVGIFAGLASMVKLPGIMVIVPVFLAHFFKSRRDRYPAISLEFFKPLAIFLGILFFVYILGNPGVFWVGGKVIGKLLSSALGIEHSDIPQGFKGNVNHWLFYLGALIRGISFPVFICSGIGLVMGLYSRRREYVVLGVFIFSFYIGISTVGNPFLIYDRYVLPILIPMVIFA